MPTINYEKLAEMVSLPMHIGIDPGAPPDRTEYHLTELGQWVTKALETMLGCGAWRLAPARYQAVIASCAEWGHVYLDSRDVTEMDPVRLLGAVSCSCCRAPIRSASAADRCWFQWTGYAYSRGICRECLGKPHKTVANHIVAQDARLYINPRARMWEKGGHGVRLECAVEPKRPIYLVDLLDPVSHDEVYRQMHEAFNHAIRWADKQITETLIGQNVATGQMMELGDDGLVKPAANGKFAEAVRVGIEAHDAAMGINPSWLAPAKIAQKLCHWCDDAGRASEHATHCAALESLYEERVRNGTPDCPEEREAVRRFYKRNNPPYPLFMPRGDHERMADRHGVGYDHIQLDQRIAAARAEQEVKRGAHDWSVWSTATDES